MPGPGGRRRCAGQNRGRARRGRILRPGAPVACGAGPGSPDLLGAQGPEEDCACFAGALVPEPCQGGTERLQVIDGRLLFGSLGGCFLGPEGLKFLLGRAMSGAGFLHSLVGLLEVILELLDASPQFGCFGLRPFLRARTS